MEKSRRKKLASAAAAIALLSGAWMYWNKDSYIARAVEKYGSEILGVTVKLKSSRLSVWNQSLELRGLFVGNPAGFKSKFLLQLEAVSVKLDVSSLPGDVVLVREISVQKPEITYEKIRGVTNLEVVQRHADAYAREAMKALPVFSGETRRKKEKRFIIDEVVVRDGKAMVLSDQVLTPNLSVSLPNLHLRDIGRRSGGATSADATKQVFAALTSSVTNAVGSAIAEAAKDVSKELGKGAKSLGDTLNGLFRGAR